MTNQELFQLLEERATEYRLQCAESINRNKHMNGGQGKIFISQVAIDAILTDYINFIAAKNGCDLGLYVKDLKGLRK